MSETVEGQPAAQDLEARLAAAEQRAAWAMTRVGELQAELHRSREWRSVTIGAVVAVALLAILMLGLVAFNAVDDSETGMTGETGAVGGQLTARSVPFQ